jgi:hypothetical protein
LFYIGTHIHTNTEVSGAATFAEQALTSKSSNTGEKARDISYVLIVHSNAKSTVQSEKKCMQNQQRCKSYFYQVNVESRVFFFKLTADIRRRAALQKAIEIPKHVV